MSCSPAYPLLSDAAQFFSYMEQSFADNVLAFIDCIDNGLAGSEEYASIAEQYGLLHSFAFQIDYCKDTSAVQDYAHSLFNMSANNKIDMNPIIITPYGNVQLNLCETCNDCTDGTPGSGTTAEACADIGSGSFTLTPGYYDNGGSDELLTLTLALTTGNTVTDWPTVCVGVPNTPDGNTLTLFHTGGGIYHIDGSSYSITGTEAWTFMFGEVVMDYNCTKDIVKAINIVQ